MRGSAFRRLHNPHAVPCRTAVQLLHAVNVFFFSVGLPTVLFFRNPLEFPLIAFVQTFRACRRVVIHSYSHRTLNRTQTTGVMWARMHLGLTARFSRLFGCPRLGCKSSRLGECRPAIWMLLGDLMSPQPRIAILDLFSGVVIARLETEFGP